MAFYWQIVCLDNATVLTVRSQLILCGNHVWHRVQPRWENSQIEMYSNQFIAPVSGILYTLPYLVPSSKDSSFASQAKTDGTNDARLAGSIGSNNHVQIWSRIHFSVVISPVKRNVNIIWFPAVILKKSSVEYIQGTLTLLRFLCVYDYKNASKTIWERIETAILSIYFILFLMELGLSKMEMSRCVCFNENYMHT